MCHPIAVTAISAATTAIGALREGNAAQASAEAQAQIAEQQAQAQRNVAQFEVAQERRERRRALGQQVAQFGSQGTALTGQPIDLLADSAKQNELALQAIRFRSEIGAQNLENDAALKRFQGRQARSDGIFKAGTALLTGGTEIARTLNTPADPVVPPIPRRNPFRG